MSLPAPSGRTKKPPTGETAAKEKTTKTRKVLR
jgi:hypothetical protein